MKHKQLGSVDKALNIAIGAMFGALIPIIGLLLGCIALRTVLPLRSRNALTIRKRKATIVVAVLAIVMSCTAVAGYYLLYRHYRLLDMQEVENAQRIQKDEENKKKNDENKLKEERELKTNLNYCLDNSNDDYLNYLKLNATSTGVDDKGQTTYFMPQQYWDIAASQKKSKQDECYRAYNAGILSPVKIPGYDYN